ncbi:YCII domain-containing protein [Yersinia intermedia]|uniref:YciI family protein n=1 Tax=Yersinia intermedia TaxID=631 RepID=UPI0005DDF658|nr:YciI family protein [Yersinia intermedia]CQD74103.1 YCII domain-containing protein [Yersinia intermedia]
MFVVSLTYHKPIDVVEALTESHKEWLKKYYTQGVFIASGRKVPRTGGIILAKSIAREELDKILAEDPFNAVVDYSVTEFIASMAIESVETLKTL